MQVYAIHPKFFYPVVLVAIAALVRSAPLPAQNAPARTTPATQQAAPVAAATAPARTPETKPAATALNPESPKVTDPRQAQLIADTRKLINISRELQSDLAKSNKDTLSLALVKKVEELQRLAKIVQTEMDKAP